MTVALITGASSGIGEAAARRLAREPGMELILVARREDRLRALCEELGGRYLAVDLTGDDAPQRVVEVAGDRIDLLVNNAGAAWRGEFADKGYANVRRTMDLNFDAVVRLTEALLPALLAAAPSAIVNIGSTAGRVARGGSAAYSASKFALNGWTDGLHLELEPRGVHVGLVLPGFVKTEGFPAEELPKWLPSTPDKVADAIVDCWRGKAERYVPRPYWLAAYLRVAAPRLTRRVLGGRSAKRLVTRTGADS